jgi:hypothetical protein
MRSLVSLGPLAYLHSLVGNSTTACDYQRDTDHKFHFIKPLHAFIPLQRPDSSVDIIYDCVGQSGTGDRAMAKLKTGGYYVTICGALASHVKPGVWYSCFRIAIFLCSRMQLGVEPGVGSKPAYLRSNATPLGCPLSYRHTIIVCHTTEGATARLHQLRHKSGQRAYPHPPSPSVHLCIYLLL